MVRHIRIYAVLFGCDYHFKEELEIRLIPRIEESSSISLCIARFFCLASIMMSKSRLRFFAILKRVVQNPLRQNQHGNDRPVPTLVRKYGLLV